MQENLRVDTVVYIGRREARSSDKAKGNVFGS